MHHHCKDFTVYWRREVQRLVLPTKVPYLASVHVPAIGSSALVDASLCWSQRAEKYNCVRRFDVTCSGECPAFYIARCQSWAHRQASGPSGLLWQSLRIRCRPSYRLQENLPCRGHATQLGLGCLVTNIFRLRFERSQPVFLLASKVAGADQFIENQTNLYLSFPLCTFPSLPCGSGLLLEWKHSETYFLLCMIRKQCCALLPLGRKQMNIILLARMCCAKKYPSSLHATPQSASFPLVFRRLLP
eukprot:284815876_2